MIKAVIFDMDGLMFDTEKIGIQTWKKISVEFGYPKLDGLIFTCFGTNHNYKRKYFAEVLGKDFPYDDFVRREVEITGEELRKNGVPLKDGLLELLDYLEKKKIKKAVATSTPQHPALDTLKSSGVLERFDAIVTGDMVVNSKPAPDIFLLACEKVGVEPKEAMGLEDSFNGIRAISAAGMKAVMIPDMVEPNEEISALYYKKALSLNDVIDIIDEINGGEK